ncbi:copper resistance CopC family protein [Georgenia yuyongxinii]|uniref:Copper resistance protein CopC n=1 Tax=Georgenia yuyongxinii TaxID=2589797 RepID=A0A552WJY2_9MICO|nr:copper resistance CopC family protein [Georgenia yuyongxinii]TRW43062.1 copper resistance protein CopC [Georgenia yuyongxinii]
MPVRILRLLLVLGALLVLPTVPAAAHDELVSTTPADRATVDVPPGELQLVFSQPVLGVGTQVVVEDPDGNLIAAGEPQVAGGQVVVPLPDALPAGQYRVRWRVTSGDGHPVTGELRFIATAGTTAVAAPPVAPPPVTAAPAPSDIKVPAPGVAASTAAAEPTSDSAAVRTVEGAASTSAATTVDAVTSGPSWLLLAAAGGCALIAVLAVAVLAAGSRTPERVTARADRWPPRTEG